MATKMPPLKLIHLEVENVKRLRAVSITPEGNVIEITGRNSQGKTSLLDSLWWALAGTGDIQRSPIRNGEETARIHLDLGPLKVTRRFNVKKPAAADDDKKAAPRKDEPNFTTSIIVENEEGLRYQSPQSILDALISQLSIDPLAFTRVDSKAQFEMLKKLAPGVDFAAIDAANRVDYETRTDINREVKTAKAQVSAIVVPDSTPDVPIDEAALVDELAEAGNHNTSLERKRSNRATLASEIASERDQAAQHDERAAELRREADKAEADATRLRTHADESQGRLEAAGPLPEPINVTEITARLQASRDTNAVVRQKLERTRLLAFIESREKDAEACTARMSEREQQKQTAIAEAKVPVAGIGFGDGFVTLNGQPFEQASDAEQLRAAIQIAIAGNPKLRLVRVRDGSLLDDDSWKLLESMANELDFQVLVETVKSERPAAIVIEDGMVVGAAEQKVAAE